MAEDEPKSPSRGWQQVYGEQRFVVLLVILFVLLAGPPILFGFGMSGSLFDNVMSLLMLRDR